MMYKRNWYQFRLLFWHSIENRIDAPRRIVYSFFIPQIEVATNYPLDAQITPRFAGSPTFLRLPQQQNLEGLDVALQGIPFDGAASFRPGARFGPCAIREMSSLLRPFNRVFDIDPYKNLNCADVGDCPINPFNTMESLDLMANDVDGVDPAFAPGTGTPEIGGFTSQQMMALLHRLRGLNIVGADIVEVSPAYDNAGITALLAARVAFEITSLLALQRASRNSDTNS